MPERETVERARKDARAKVSVDSGWRVRTRRNHRIPRHSVNLSPNLNDFTDFLGRCGSLEFG